jgi:hypothetical protein
MSRQYTSQLLSGQEDPTQQTVSVVANEHLGEHTDIRHPLAQRVWLLLKHSEEMSATAFYNRRAIVSLGLSNWDNQEVTGLTTRM